MFVMHGEDEVENIFVDTLTGQGFTAGAPYNVAQWAICAEGAVCLQEGTKVRIQHKVSEGQNRAATEMCIRDRAPGASFLRWLTLNSEVGFSSNRTPVKFL